MNRQKYLAIALLGLLSTLAVQKLAAADKPTAVDPSSGPQIKLPPGWTEADLQACMLAGTPGKMHDVMAKDLGVWKGKNTMWMAPGADPMSTDCTLTITPLFDGRYTKSEMTGEMPGMGPFTGLGINGFDNVSQQFVSTWIDNHSTGIMTGTGELSKDGKTMTWNYTMNCPITKQPATIRQVETSTGQNSKKIEMFTTDPKSSKEYKMMSIELTRN
jgi:hypothetical protein